MDWLNCTLHFFQDDPLRILTLVGGSGGLVYWISLCRNRRKLHVYMREEKLYIFPHPYLKFVARNLGTIPTSLKPEIVLKGFTEEREKCSAVFCIPPQDCYLPPHESRELKAVTERKDSKGNLHKLWFGTYVFKLSRGWGYRIHRRGAMIPSRYIVLSWPRFYCQLLRFRLGGKIEMRP